MDVDLVGSRISFPGLCSCCAEATGETRMVGHTRHSGRVRHLTRWTVPCCSRCSRHIEAARWGGGVAVLLFFLALGSLGLLSPLLWLWVRHRRALAQSLRGPECGAAEGMTYEPLPVPGGPGHRFRGAHREFVRVLALANRAALHAPSPEVTALLR